MRSSGRLAFVCWRSLIENELDLLLLRAAGLEAMLDPTPFSFAKPDYLRATLQTAGFQQISIRAHDEAVSSGDLDAMATVLLRVGPLGKVLRENPELRPAAEPRLRAALAARGSLSRRAHGSDLDCYGASLKGWRSGVGSEPKCRAICVRRLQDGDIGQCPKWGVCHERTV
jgi:hypothetical protein